MKLEMYTTQKYGNHCKMMLPLTNPPLSSSLLFSSIFSASGEEGLLQEMAGAVSSGGPLNSPVRGTSVDRQSPQTTEPSLGHPHDMKKTAPQAHDGNTPLAWHLTFASCPPVAYGGMDEVTAQPAVAKAFAALLTEPGPRQRPQTCRVCLCLLQRPAGLTQGQVKQQTLTTSCLNSADGYVSQITERVLNRKCCPRHHETYSAYKWKWNILVQERKLQNSYYKIFINSSDTLSLIYLLIWLLWADQRKYYND